MDEIQRKEFHGKSLIQWMIPTRTFVMWSVSIVFLLLIAGFVSLQLWAHFHFKAVLKYDPLYAEMKELLNKNTEFPEEYRKSPPLSDAMKRALLDRSQNRKKFDVYKRVQNTKWNLISNEELIKFFDELHPFIQSESELARQIAIDLQNYPLGSPLPILPGISAPDNLLERRFSFRFCNKQNGDALHDAVDAILLSIACPFRYYDYYWHSLSENLLRILRNAEPIAPFVESKECLRNTLRSLNSVEPVLFQDLSDVEETLVLMNVYYHYYGRDSTPGKTWEHNFDRSIKKNIPEFKKRNLLDLEAHLINLYGFSDAEAAVWLQPIAFSDYVNDYIRLCGYRKYPFPHFSIYSNVKKKQAETGASFDRLRLSIAARLYELETGKKVAATTDLVPAYFPNEIKNRQSGESYRWNENGYLWGF